MRVGRNSPTNNKYFFRLANRSKCQENINEEEDDLTRTWVGVRWIRAARCSRSGALRYFCCLNRLSSSWTCCWVNRTRRFRLCGRWGNCIAPTPMPTPTPTPTPTPMPDDLVTSPIDWPTEQPAMLVPAPAAAAPISRETATQHSKYQSRYSSRCTNKQKNNIILHSWIGSLHFYLLIAREKILSTFSQISPRTFSISIEKSGVQLPRNSFQFSS